MTAITVGTQLEECLKILEQAHEKSIKINVIKTPVQFVIVL